MPDTECPMCIEFTPGTAPLIDVPMERQGYILCAKHAEQSTPPKTALQWLEELGDKYGVDNITDLVRTLEARVQRYEMPVTEEELSYYFTGQGERIRDHIEDFLSGRREKSSNED